jgi:AcrR family transcriptional regulator
MARATKQQFLEVAHEMFLKRGLAGVGIDEVAAEVGVSKTTFYNHFESKDDLVVQVMLWRNQWVRERVGKQLRKRAGDSPRAQLLAIFDLLEDVFDSDGFCGCIFIKASGNHPMPNDPINMVTSQHTRGVISAIRELGAYAGAENPHQFAEEMGILIAGAYALSQMDSARRVAGVAKRLGKELIERHIPRSVAPARRLHTRQSARAG